MALHVFGLTGGIGTGKSTVAAHWRSRGLPVVDADTIAREVVAPGSEGLAAIVEAFGREMLTPLGTLDRERLADHVFADSTARKHLESITHPRVRELSQARFAEFGAQGEPLACYDVPLLIESGLADALRPLVVVTAPESVQVDRTMDRDGTSEAQVRARIAAQMPLADKAALADYVIDNSGTREATAARADAVLAEICASLSIDPGRYTPG